MADGSLAPQRWRWNISDDRVGRTMLVTDGGGMKVVLCAGGNKLLTRDPVSGTLVPVKEADEIARLIVMAPQMLEALRLAEKANDVNCACEECMESAQAPEVCERCFPPADDARVARRLVLQALGVIKPEAVNG